MSWSIFTQGGGDQVAVGWAHQLLKLIGAPESAGNVQFIYQWEKAEGAGGKYNPLNQGPVSGHPELTTTGSQYGGGAADFASWDAGLKGASIFLSYPQYSKVLSNLKSDNPAAAREALWASPWAASHYGYGSHWPNVAIPGGTMVLPGTLDLAGIGVQQASNPSNCVWFLNFGSVFSGCLLSKPQARSVIGTLLLGVGGVVFIAGILVIVAFALPGQFGNVGKTAVNIVRRLV